MAQAYNGPEVSADHRLSPRGDARCPPVGRHPKARTSDRSYPSDRLPAAEFPAEQPSAADTGTTILPTRGQEKRLLMG